MFITSAVTITLVTMASRASFLNGGRFVDISTKAQKHKQNTNSHVKKNPRSCPIVMIYFLFKIPLRLDTARYKLVYSLCLKVAR